MRKLLLSALVIFLMTTSCGQDKAAKNPDNNSDAKTEESAAITDPMSDKGIGPIKSVTLADEIDMEMVATGEKVFNTKCSVCHKPDKRFVGPAPKGIFERRSPEWIMNMILNPEEMVQKNPTAKALLAEYLSPMANQNLTEEEARAVLEYFRTLN